MRQRPLWRALLAAAGALLLLAPAPARAQGAVVGRLQTVSGAVEVVRGAAARAATGGADLLLGDTVRTGANGRARVVTLDGKRATLGPNSSVTLGRANRPAAWQMQAGRAAVWVTGSRRTEVATPGATAAAEGTGFELVVEPDGTTTLTVAEGMVDYYNDQGRVVVASSQQSVARPGQAPARPVTADPSGMILFEATVENLPLPIEPPRFFDPGPGAAGPFRVALAAIDERRPDAVQPALEALRAQNADSAETRLAEGLFLLAQGKAAEAAGHLARVGELAPRSPAGPTYHGAALLRQGWLPEAEKVLREAIAREPRAYAAHAYLASTLLARGSVKEAEEAARRAVELEPQSQLSRESLGSVLLFTGRPAEAARELRLALVANPLSPTARTQLAKALAGLDDLDGALEQATQAVALDPENASARATLGVLFMASRDADRAEREFRYALKLAPAAASARTGLAAAALQRGRFAQALKEQKAALEMDEGSAQGRNNLGVALTARGQLGEAIRVLQEAVRLQPDYAVAHANLAIAHVELNQYPEAVSAAERAVELGDRSAFVRTTLARIYLRQHRNERALAELRRAVEVDPAFPLARFYLARLYLLQGRDRDSLRSLFWGLTLDPATAVEQRLFARTETAFGGGEDGTIQANGKTDGRTANGRVSYFLSGAHLEEDGPRRNDDDRTDFGEGIIGYQPGPRHNLILYGSLIDGSGGRPGARPGLAAAPLTPLFRSDLNGTDLELLSRIQLQPKSHLTLKAGWRRLSVQAEDPLDTFTFRDFRNREGNILVEGRWDHGLGAGDALVSGVSWQQARRRFNGTFPLVPGPGFGSASNSTEPDFLTGYFEWHHALDARTDFLVGPYFGAQSDGADFVLPKFVGRHRMGDGSTLALLAYPIYQERNGDLRPVETWARPFFISQLGLDDSGWLMSYEGTWQKPLAREAILTATGFYRRAHRLLVPVTDPFRSGLASRGFFPRGELLGGELSYERWLTRTLSTRVFGLYQETNSLLDFDRLPYFPRWKSGVRLDYLDRSGIRAFVSMDYTAGRRHLDFVGGPGRDLGGYITADLRVEWQQSIKTTLFLEVRDLFDRRPDFYLDFPSNGRTILGGIERRF